ncbi:MULTISPECIES: hypothetical protein [unclassified Pseudomonas]|uniref:hypothetical protein n=1 Tax=unclassified Pseudomonas TaxID=196821 RepID=UPI001181F415|nr:MULTISPECIES: hypothetical protein [unclassified Pseudomonas]
MTIDKAKLRAAAIDWGHHAMEITGDDMQALLDEIDQLRSENEALREDADRYRWLRRVGGRKYGNVLPGVPGTNHIYDIGVDAEMAKESAHG